MSYMNDREYFDMMEEAHAAQAARVYRHQYDMVGQVNDLIADLCQAETPEQVVDALAENEQRVIAAAEEIRRIRKRNPLGFC